VQNVQFLETVDSINNTQNLVKQVSLTDNSDFPLIAVIGCDLLKRKCSDKEKSLQSRSRYFPTHATGISFADDIKLLELGSDSLHLCNI